MQTPILSPEELAPIVDRVRIVDARAGVKANDAYAVSHLVGAVRADPNVDLAAHVEDPARGGRHPLPPLDAFARTLGAWAITRDVDVVVYDEVSGANAAARLWWMLRAVGHARVAVLDGGLQAAVAAGIPTSAEAPVIAAAPPYPVPADWMLPRASMDDVDARRLDGAWRVVDVRAPFRFRGESDPFDPNPGHVPGAINVPYEKNLDARGRFADAAALRAMYAPMLPAGGADHVVVHCGSGVTACHTLLAMERAGLPGASLYVGSWSEWGRNDRPRARGE